MDGSNVVSVFDGMACGMLAMMEAGVKVGRYVAYEIDKYAVQTSSHNFPQIEHRGDVFQADFREFEGFDWLVGGSPCTYWSIAQKNNRETEASGLGWELFCQYVRALREVKPRFFIYENNKSMAKAIRQSITETFGFDPICINSALVSAQNRQRLYWVGKRNEDGSYSKVDVRQPEDRGILLKDVLDGVAFMDKSYTIDSNYHKTLGQQGFDHQSGRRKMAKLIDADALKKEIVDFKLNLHPQNQDYGTGYFSALSVVEGMLAYAPTVDDVEVVHGRWEEWYPPAHMILTGEEMLYRCSACTAKYPDVEGFNYCPYCGAVMENKYHESTD